MATKYRRQEKPTNLLLPGDIAPQIQIIDTYTAGELFKAIYMYYESEEEPEFDDIVENIIFQRVKLTMDYSREKYEGICEQQRARRSAGSKKAQLIEKINEFFEVVSVYEYSQYMKTDSTKVDRFLEVMEELRVSELEEFLENTKRYEQYIIEDIRNTEVGSNITPFRGTGTE